MNSFYPTPAIVVDVLAEGAMPGNMGDAMAHMGFCGDPRKWVGKVIEDVEYLEMESVSGCATLFKFSDGTRGWTVGRGMADGLLSGPSPMYLDRSRIITAEEKDAIKEAQQRRQDLIKAEQREEKQRQLRMLKSELGED